MPLQRLPSIALQLCMQPLDVRSLLSLSRCCRLTLACASCPFVFAHQPPFVVCSLQPDLAQCIARSLVRFLPIEVRWLEPVVRGAFTKRRTLLEHERRVMETAALLAIPGLRGLDALSQEHADWAEVLQHHQFAELRVLRMGSGLSGTAGIKLSGLAQLRELTIRCVASAELFSEIGSLVLLSTLSLQLHLQYTTSLTAAIISPLSRCTALRKLTLGCWPSAVLQHILTPQLSLLEDLTLDRMFSWTQAPGQHEDDSGLFACLSSPPRLSHVSLLRCRDIASPLSRGLAPNGPLRHLLVQPHLRTDVPTPGDLGQLLDRLPLLQSLQFELPRIGPMSPAEQRRMRLTEHQAPMCLRYQDEVMHLPPELRAQISSTRVACEQLAAQFAPVVSLVECEALKSRMEVDDALRSRFSVVKKERTGCCVC